MRLRYGITVSCAGDLIQADGHGFLQLRGTRILASFNEVIFLARKLTTQGFKAKGDTHFQY
jgi:hypothetical protein